MFFKAQKFHNNKVTCYKVHKLHISGQMAAALQTIKRNKHNKIKTKILTNLVGYLINKYNRITMLIINNLKNRKKIVIIIQMKYKRLQWV